MEKRPFSDTAFDKYLSEDNQDAGDFEHIGTEWKRRWGPNPAEHRYLILNE